jgi:hypothetical protein
MSKMAAVRPQKLLHLFPNVGHSTEIYVDGINEQNNLKGFLDYADSFERREGLRRFVIY